MAPSIIFKIRHIVARFCEDHLIGFEHLSSIVQNLRFPRFDGMMYLGQSTHKWRMETI